MQYKYRTSTTHLHVELSLREEVFVGKSVGVGGKVCPYICPGQNSHLIWQHCDREVEPSDKYSSCVYKGEDKANFSHLHIFSRWIFHLKNTKYNIGQIFTMVGNLCILYLPTSCHPVLLPLLMRLLLDCCGALGGGKGPGAEGNGEYLV